MDEKTPKEYNAVINNVGLFDFSMEGKIKIKGDGRINFINGIVSNDVKNLKENFGVYAAFLDKFGRVLSDCHVFNFKDFLLITLPFSQKNRIFKKLKEEAPLAKSEAEDLTLKYALISLQGPKSINLLGALFKEKIDLQLLSFANKNLLLNINKNNEKINNKPIGKNNNLIEATIIKSKRSSLESYDLLFEGNHYNEVLNLIMEKAKNFNLTRGDKEVYEILRIEAGIPLFGIDFNEKTILPEVGEKAISYDKGCFVGQEVIARIKNIGKGITAKKLMKFEINTGKKFEKGTEIFKDNKKIGFITSSAFSPSLKKVVALGYLERPYYENVKEVEVSESKIDGEVR